MLHSLLMHNPGRRITVHYLHAPDFSPACRNQLQAFVERHGGRIAFLPIDDAAVAGLPTMGRIPRVMWYRIFLPELLPDVDRVLYLDADTLVVDELDSLFAQPLDDAYVAAVTNVLEPQFARRPLQLGLPVTQPYFNSGVLLFNLAAMRAGDCTARIVRFAREETLLWPDQDALNVVLGGNCVHLHPRWNCMNSLFLFPQARAIFGPEVVRAACAEPAIVHFEGPELAKPWHYLSKHPYRHAYLAHRAATPWPDVEIEGRTLRNRVLRPLPTPAALAVLGKWLRLRAAADQRLTHLTRRTRLGDPDNG
ncbi:MAG: LPS:glycosyltransferase [Actinomycetia bacterium]|nr:LPS:glycosyltransferase [Actinomycetes bacterium]